MKRVIFGAGSKGRFLAFVLRKCGEEVVCFLDNNSQYDGTYLLGIPVFSPAQIPNIEYDEIICATRSYNEQIINQLTSLGVERCKISLMSEEKLTEYYDFIKGSLNQFIYAFASQASVQKMAGSVAELGVYQGRTAKEINRAFPQSNCYLFDTFEGFNRADLEVEHSKTAFDREDNFETTRFQDTSVQFVLSQMHYPERVIVKKGWFPETFDLPDDEQFLLVNCDMDLYEPMKAAIDLFYPRMVEGGVIIFHDAFSTTKASLAFEEMKKKYHFTSIPLGDFTSYVIIKRKAGEQNHEGN